MTQGAVPAISHNAASEASKVRAIGFSFRWNQRIMAYSLALDRDVVYL